MNIKLKSILSAAALGLGLIAAARAAEPMEVTSLDDIKTWVGEGQNEIGVLVDFSGCGAWAWGYRWDGERPDNETILAAIREADPRLKMTDEDGLRGLVYDVADTGVSIEMDPGDLDWEDEDGDEFPSIIWGMEDCEYLAWQWLESEDHEWLVLTLNEIECDFDALSYVWWAAEPYEGGGGEGDDDEQGFTFKDIHYWVGEGENRCAVIIDWSNGGGKTLAWGYRWSGTCTNLAEVVARIAHEDQRLVQGAQLMTSDYLDLYFFGYDVNDCRPGWDMANGASTDPEAYALSEDSVYYSVWWVLYGDMNGEEFPADEPQTSSWFAADQITPQNDDWYVFSWGCPEYDANWTESPAYLAEPSAAESPYGYAVVDSMTSETKANFSDATNVLGHPTMYMHGMWGGPITPANPAWMAGELFTLKTDSYDEGGKIGTDDGPGYVTIKFDHDVKDDPANPFGLDFIVFGNAMTILTSSDYIYESGDPRGQKCSGKGNVEAAKVEVSQDGETWYTSEKWASPDGFAPTLGYRYEPTNADPLLFSGNKYWGRAAQATKPVDPSADFVDTESLSVADVCNRYAGSAGGRGYDLKDVNLSWIRYVRVSGVYDDGDGRYTEPEVDAVADVAPTSAYAKWVEVNYTDWHTAWDENISGAEAVAKNGKVNGVNFLLGLSATDTASELDFKIADFEPGDTTHTLVILTKEPLTENCGFVVEGGNKLGRWTAREVPLLEESIPYKDGYANYLKVSASCGRFLRLKLTVE